MQGSPCCQTPMGALHWAPRATPCHLVPLPMGVEVLVGEQQAPGSLGNGAKSCSPGLAMASSSGASSPLTAPAQSCSQGYEAHGPTWGQLGSSLPASLGTRHCVTPCTALTTMKCAVSLSARSGCCSVWTELHYRLTPNVHLNQVPLPVGAQYWVWLRAEAASQSWEVVPSRGWHRRWELDSTGRFKNKMIILKWMCRAGGVCTSLQLVMLADFKGWCMDRGGNLHQDQSTSKSKLLGLVSSSSTTALQLCVWVSICKKLHCPVE